MDEHDHGAKMASVTVPACDETLIGQSEGGIEGSCCGEEIMVELVGSDVFVDGVGGDELEKEGLGGKMGAFDGKGGCGGAIHDLAAWEFGDVAGEEWDGRNRAGGEAFRGIVGPSGKRICDVIEEEVEVVRNEGGLERGKELAEEAVEQGGQAVDGVSGHDFTSEDVSGLGGEVWDAGLEASLVSSSLMTESLTTQRQVVVEEVDVMVKEEGLHSKEVLDSNVGKMSLHCSDEDKNPSIETGSVETAVCVNAGGEVGSLNKLETFHSNAAESDVRNENVPSSLEDWQLMTNAAGENSQTHGSCGVGLLPFIKQTNVVAHGEVAAVEDMVSSNPKVETPKDFDMSEKIGGCAGEVSIAPTDSESSVKQTSVAVDYSITSHSKVLTSDSAANVSTREDSGAFDDNIDCMDHQELNAENIGRSSKTDVVACAEPESSSEQTHVVNVSGATKVEVPLSDMSGRLATPEFFENVKSETTCGNAGKESDADPESSHVQSCVNERGEGPGMNNEVVLDCEDSMSGNNKQLKVHSIENESWCTKDDISVCTRVFDGNEVVEKESKVSKPDMDAMQVSEGFRNLKCETIHGKAGKDGVVPADPESSYELAIVRERGEAVGMDTEGVLDWDDTGIHEQPLKVQKVDGSSTNDVTQENLEFSAEPIQIADRGVMAAMDYKEVLKSDVEAKTKDDRADLSLGQTLNAQATAVSSDDQVESTMMVCQGQAQSQGIVDLPLFDTLDGNVLLKEDEDVKTAGRCTADDVVTEDLPRAVEVCHSQTTGTSFATSKQNTDEEEEAVVLASNDTHLGRDPSLETCASDVVPFNEAVNQLIEVKDESRKVDDKAIVCARVPEAKNLNISDNRTIDGGLVVDMDTPPSEEGECKLQSVNVKENVSVPLELHCFEDHTKGMEGDAKVQVLECLDESADCCVVTLKVGQEAEVEESSKSKGNEVNEKIPEKTALKHEAPVIVHQSCYLPPPESEGEFSVSDLVWGKVRSHPWWPGQIFDPADASEKAMKYHKKDCFLVAYFGDRTFAWNDASFLKPFRTHFSQTEKQSNSDTFHYAVSCALEEVSRRVELGLACSCISKVAYDKIESQIAENTGIRQESSRRHGVDKSSGASCFEPDKLVDNIRALAQSPSGGGDQLELVIAKAQLLAFYRFKGYSRLPEFQLGRGLLENDAVNQNGDPVSKDNEQIISQDEKLKVESSSRKRKSTLMDSLYPSKKERSLSDLMDDTVYSPDCEDEPDGKATSKSVASSAGRRRKALDSVSDGSNRRISFYAAKVSTTASPVPKPSFKVGECIRRVASQLTGSPSLLKCNSDKLLKADGSSDQLVESDGSLHTPENSQKGRMIVPAVHSSLDEMLSQLYLAAQDPMKGYRFLPNIVTFFSGFRHSIALDKNSGKQNSSKGRVAGGRKRKASNDEIRSPEEFEFDDVNDSYWTDRVVQNHAEEQLLHNSLNGGGNQLVVFEPDKPLKSNRRSHSRKRVSTGNHKLEAEEPNEQIDVRKDLLPVELILNFTKGGFVPSEINLNKMFRRFGPLKESETEVDSETSRAKVVFKRGSDAEVAFSSAGKFKIFGPVLVNYELSYSPSVSFKTLPLAMLQDQDDAT
ncbi:hypothetical protein RJ640_003717 [Escallonia rubra]|uniref:PWWP domain-containing protein n=1 Tax=Escallonia rubra TaxID=112253 RepID=A0AA88UUB9_9ASTE|nr:hypothetical protein RJ640_003717 [Escallonia rubra]